MKDYDVPSIRTIGCCRRADPLKAVDDTGRFAAAAARVCGSDAMNINGKNASPASLTKDAEGARRAAASAARLPVIRDPIVTCYFSAVPPDHAVRRQRHAAAREGAPQAPEDRVSSRLRVHPALLPDRLPVFW
jgi:succinate dehydrogenase/fumarate reductase-like Fe-S protein